MCGIAGIWSFNAPLEIEALRLFTDSMLHRGPDGAGYMQLTENLGLGHRRLSILDLTENGKQPMQFANGNYTITYNGEVYNFIELKAELENFGYTFKTTSDTEVILAAYHKWGKDCLLKFNGMFAFALWDKIKQSLFLARDRFGVKPLHYLYIPNKIFAFASETIAFKRLANYNRSFNTQNLLRAIHNNQIIEPFGQTIFNNIFQLQAGHYIEFLKDKRPEQIRWWNTFDHLTTIPEKYTDQIEEFKNLFEDACKIRLRSDVSIASALSGGVDSSSVYCMIKHLMQKNRLNERTPENWQQAFVATFPGTSQDEKKYAEEVIKYTNGEVVYIQPDYNNLPQQVINSTLLFDGICGTPIIAVTDVYKAMRNKGITVSIDGHGGDEILFGYRPSVFEAYVYAVQSNNGEYAQDILDTFANLSLPEDKVKVLNSAKERLNAILEFEKKKSILLELMKNVKHLLKEALIPKKALPNYQCSNWYHSVELPAVSFLSSSPYGFSKFNRADRALAEDFHIHHIPYNLRDFDRAAMQHSIEIRMPLLDYRLVCYAFSLPLNSKIGSGYTKRILRDSMKGLMPEEIRNRKLKIGLSAPLIDWFKTSLKQWTLDEIHSQNFKCSNLWDANAIINDVNEVYKHDNWNNSFAQQLWSLLNASIILNKNSNCKES